MRMMNEFEAQVLSDLKTLLETGTPLPVQMGA